MRKTTVLWVSMSTSEGDSNSGTRAVTGPVKRRRVAQGSKSDRVAIILRTEKGDEFILRREGGNAFQDATLDRLVGSVISAKGRAVGQTFIMSTWKVKQKG